MGEIPENQAVPRVLSVLNPTTETQKHREFQKKMEIQKQITVSDPEWAQCQGWMVETLACTFERQGNKASQPGFISSVWLFSVPLW